MLTVIWSGGEGLSSYGGPSSAKLAMDLPESVDRADLAALNGKRSGNPHPKPRVAKPLPQDVLKQARFMRREGHSYRYIGSHLHLSPWYVRRALGTTGHSPVGPRKEPA